MEILLYNGMSVDLRNGDDSAPLRLAGACCNLETTKAFVERGAAVGKGDMNGDTALLSAAGYG